MSINRVRTKDIQAAIAMDSRAMSHFVELRAKFPNRMYAVINTIPYLYSTCKLSHALQILIAVNLFDAGCCAEVKECD